MSLSHWNFRLFYEYSNAGRTNYAICVFIVFRSFYVVIQTCRYFPMITSSRWVSTKGYPVQTDTPTGSVVFMRSRFSEKAVSKRLSARVEWSGRMTKTKDTEFCDSWLGQIYLFRTGCVLHDWMLNKHTGCFWAPFSRPFLTFPRTINGSIASIVLFVKVI